MKKRCLFIVFLLLICLSFFKFSLTESTSYAYDELNVVTFEISNENDEIKITKKSTLENSQFDSWENVLVFVTDNSEETDTACLDFQYFNLDSAGIESLSFNISRNVVCSGTITSTSENPVIVLTSNQSLTLRKLTINAENAELMVGFLGTGNTLYFAEDVTYTDYDKDTGACLAEYKEDNKIITIEPNTNIKLYVSDFIYENELVVECENSYKNFIKIYSPEISGYNNTSIYTSYYKYPEGDANPILIRGISVTSYVTFNFKLNGGKYSNLLDNYNFTTSSYELSYTYGSSSGLVNFANQGTPERSYATFDGFYGFLQVGEEKYYFDLDMLQNYIEQDGNLENIDDYFTTSLSDVNNEKSIKYYSSYDKTSLENYKHFEIFKNNGLAPTYIAKWIVEEFTISFVTDNGDILPSIKVEYGQKIPDFETIIKDGYTFDGWYKNESKTTKFDKSKPMPAENLTLYAKWVPNKYELIFDTKGGSEIDSIQFEFGEQTSRPDDPEKTGYDFINWYIDDETFAYEFDFGTMPNHDVTVYARWTKKIYYISLHVAVTNKIRIISVEYDSNISEIDTYIPGYEFKGFYTSAAYDEQFNMNQKVTEDIDIYAKYVPINYHITLFNNYDTEMESQVIEGHYGDNVSLPVLVRENYIFGGWYYDDGVFENQCNLKNMPAENVNIYAKWTMKQTLIFDLKPQSYTYTAGGLTYSNETGYSNVIIYYLVDDEWTTSAPIEVGSYDVRAVRAEDENYLAVDVILENGFTIVQKQTSIVWLIIALYIATIIEIAVSLVVRIMLKRKLSATYVMIGNILISTSQFANLVISGLMCLAGFVYMIYQITLLTRSLNNENFKPSQEDNRERFKSDLAFQNDSKNKELDFETKTKTDESFGDKYTDEDIEKLLNNDDYAKKIIASRNKFAENKKDDEQSNTIYSQGEIDNFDNLSIQEESIESDEKFQNLSSDENEINQENIMPKYHYNLEKNESSNQDENSTDSES